MHFLTSHQSNGLLTDAIAVILSCFCSCILLLMIRPQIVPLSNLHTLCSADIVGSNQVELEVWVRKSKHHLLSSKVTILLQRGRWCLDFRTQTSNSTWLLPTIS